MAAFLLSLLPMLALEMTSVGRFGILAIFLGSRSQPIARGAAFTAGTFVSYMTLGLLFAVGLGQALQNAGGAFADRLINPGNFDYVISLFIGIVLLVLAVRLMVKKNDKESDSVPEQLKPDSKAGLFAPFITGVWSNAVLVGPNTLASFAAFNQILKAEASVPVTVTVLVGYNLLIVVPMLFFVWLSAVNRARADRIFEWMRNRAGSFGKKVIPVLCILIGLVMVADSIGFFFGHPLLPVGLKTP